ncbi:MAG: O-antigen ligase family protein [Patescibacteria group bacterium]
MNNNILLSIYLNSIKALLFSVAFLPLLISQSMLFPYITGRNFGFRILVEIALVLWVGLVVLNRDYLPKKSILLWAIVLFLAIIGIANLLGVDSYDSFWSRYERMEGYIGLLHFGVYFIIASSVLRSKKDWKIFFTFILFAGFLVGIFALQQKISGTGSIQGGSRVDGTIGNPTYLAAYSLFLLGLSLVMWHNARQKWLRYIFTGGALFFLLIIYLTASRGPLLALGGVAFLFPILFLLFGESEQRRKYKKYAFGLLAGLILLIGGFWFIKDSMFVESSPILSRFASISLTDKTTRSRLMIWNMAWQGFKERPVFGWGQENYIHVFAKYYNPKLFDQEPWFDRAHSVVFDWMINGGFLGIVSYFSLFGVAFMLLWKLKKKGTLSFFEAVIFALTLLAYFTQNLLVFDNFTTYFLFFSVLAYLHALSHDSDTKIDIHRSVMAVPSLLASGTMLVVILLPFYFINVRPILASQKLIGVLQSLTSSETTPASVRKSLEDALAYNSFGNTEINDQMARLAVQLSRVEKISIQEKVEFAKFTIMSLESRIERHPNDLRTHLMLGDLYNQFATIDPSYPKKGEDHIRKAITLSPNRQTTYFLLADNLILQNNSNEAINVLREAVDLEPTFIVAQANLAFIAENFNRSDVANEVLADLYEIIGSDYRSYDAAVALKRMGDFYISQQRFSNALQWYKLVIQTDPGQAETRANIAALYLKNGDKEEAIFQAKKAAELDPQNYAAQTKEFLKNIGAN